MAVGSVAEGFCVTDTQSPSQCWLLCVVWVFMCVCVSWHCVVLSKGVFVEHCSDITPASDTVRVFNPCCYVCVCLTHVVVCVCTYLGIVWS